MITSAAPSPRPAHRQRGGAAVFMLILIGAVVALAMFASDSARLTADAAQLKRATDAAALAAAKAHAASRDADIQDIAQRYVAANLGMDWRALSQDLTVTAQAIGQDDTPGVRVTASFVARPTLAGAADAPVLVSSSAVTRRSSIEVALALPNTLGEDASNLAALRRLGNHFATGLLDKAQSTWLALVPYSQSVSVYDPRVPDRIRRWAAPGALNPPALASLFRTGYSGLADRRIPDRRANLLCMYRGLDRGENYFWDQAPVGQFGVYYRIDLPANGSPGAPPIAWRDEFMVADRGCPSAPLLPLSNSLVDIGQRLGAMSTRFNVNYAIAMGWAAMALAPAFRGTNGWGLQDNLPRDFDDGTGDRIKAVVLLANTSDQRWFDTDSYNAYPGRRIDGTPELGGGNLDSLVTERFSRLCASFRERRLKFFLVATGNDASADQDGPVASASAFRRIAGRGLQTCAEKSTDLRYLPGRDFVVAEDNIQERLDEIVEELRQAALRTTLIE